ncbi:MAG TPA: CopG family transcriptional regulator [Planktothrix sp. UBA8407]|nr:CopG family transcriptional regulator [Planktothrix sp. UBA8407]
MTSQNPRTTLNLRIKPEDRDLIDLAAKSIGKNRTDFILESAKAAAEEALLNQTIFFATPKTYEEFITLLDAPPQPNQQLLKTMKTKAPWED